MLDEPVCGEDDGKDGREAVRVVAVGDADVGLVLDNFDIVSALWGPAPIHPRLLTRSALRVAHLVCPVTVLDADPKMGKAVAVGQSATRNTLAGVLAAEHAEPPTWATQWTRALDLDSRRRDERW